jgi:aspartyl-tRNA synthetase
LTLESVLYVSGKVQRRPGSNENMNLATGKYEVSASTIVLLNKANLPVIVNDHSILPKEETRLQHRHLDLRRKYLHNNLVTRAKIAKIIRNFLDEKGFIEVETPTLFKPTPEGAREYLVLTRSVGHCYALPQSPQQFKQLLIAGGIEKYYQFARCYRDEPLRSDRQPEFTQATNYFKF